MLHVSFQDVLASTAWSVKFLTQHTVEIKHHPCHVKEVAGQIDCIMASATTDPENTIIPARLSFLAIYNPSLGRTDETFRDQIVFYHSRLAYERRKQGQHDDQQDPILQEEENEQLRQIGLAQGMINFAQ